ncbi:MAG: hypothetical protein HRT89_21460 [Lentisphaeria bacterium]|nr:hypothetical protein [Lentisphaeria bacterium]NQZ70630.1 hypothetical protein [Lentisphaeria bacterium]
MKVLKTVITIALLLPLLLSAEEIEIDPKLKLRLQKTVDQLIKDNDLKTKKAVRILPGFSKVEGGIEFGLGGGDFHPTPISNLEALKGLPITVLTMRHTRIKDLTPLKGMKLRFLDISYTPVKDLTPLKGMPIKELRFEDDGDVELDYKILKNLPIEILDLTAKQVDLKQLKGMKLQTLKLRFCEITNLSSIKEMPELEVLDIRGAMILDLSSSKEMINDRKFRKINNNTDLEFLKEIKTLKKINRRSVSVFFGN